jgi:hypothetical protein
MNRLRAATPSLTEDDPPALIRGDLHAGASDRHGNQLPRFGDLDMLEAAEARIHARRWGPSARRAFADRRATG